MCKFHACEKCYKDLIMKDSIRDLGKMDYLSKIKYDQEREFDIRENSEKYNWDVVHIH